MSYGKEEWIVIRGTSAERALIDMVNPTIPVGTRFLETDTGAQYTALPMPGIPIALVWAPSAGPTGNVIIYVDNVTGSDNNIGTSADPLATLGEALRRLPPTWTGKAEIHLAVTGVDYLLGPNTDINNILMQFGGPVGPTGTPLMIIGGYTDEAGLITATANDASGNSVTSATVVAADLFIGATLMRVSGAGSAAGTAVPIRGNDGAGVISAQASIGAVVIGDTFRVQRPSVTIRGTGGSAWNIYCTASGVEYNLALVGVKLSAPAACFFRVDDARILCDTVEFLSSVASNFVFRGRINGGQAGLATDKFFPGIDPLRSGAGCYFHGTAATQVWRFGLWSHVGGNITCQLQGVFISQGALGVLVTLEILSGAFTVAAGGMVATASLGSATNPGRIRSAPSDALTTSNNGVFAVSTTTNLNIFGAGRDAVRVEAGGVAVFAVPGGASGLQSVGAANTGWGMNIKNGAKALVGSDANAATKLTGTAGEVALDSAAIGGGWATVVGAPQSNTSLSLVKVSAA